MHFIQLTHVLTCACFYHMLYCLHQIFCLFDQLLYRYSTRCLLIVCIYISTQFLTSQQNIPILDLILCSHDCSSTFQETFFAIRNVTMGLVRLFINLQDLLHKSRWHLRQVFQLHRLYSYPYHHFRMLLPSLKRDRQACIFEFFAREDGPFSLLLLSHCM